MRVIRKLLFILGLVLLVAGFCQLSAQRVRAEDLDQHERHGPPFSEIEDVVRWHASSRGVDGEALLRLLRCESSLDPLAVGDHGTSFGLAQLSSLPTGLLGHYQEVSGASPFETEAVVIYVADVAAGRYLPGQPEAPSLHPYGVISLARWSCWK